MRQFMLIFIIYSATAHLSAAESPAAPVKIKQYLDPRGAPTVILSAGTEQGISLGDILTAYRKQPGGGSDLIETGELKVISCGEGYAAAEVTVSETDISRVMFPKFAMVMAGDSVVSKKVVMSNQQALLPETSLAYNELFIDPKSNPATFELSTEGKQSLKDAASNYSDARIQTLMIYGYTDESGAADVNQIESYQRALTVRQFLIQELGFDAKRLVAMGHGEAEPVAADSTPGFRDQNRRIVFRALQE